MTDVLIRNLPDDVLAGLDARAAKLGLSRTEYLRRRLAQEASAGQQVVTVDHLATFAATFSALADPEVMKDAWRD